MIIVTYDVLALPAEELGARQPSKHGRTLWNMLFTKYNGRICVLADGIPKDKYPIVTEWLKREGYKAGSIDFSQDTGLDNRLDRVRAIYAGMGRVDWYIDVDPKMVALTLKEGIPSLLVSVPYIARPEWNQDKEIKQWDSLIEEIDGQALLKAERSWTEIE